MPTPSIARSFFDQIRDAPDPVAAIRELANSNPPTFECDWLDFKQQPNSDLKNPKWREMWVEAIAGFANNQGGVIVWGIDARKDPTTGADSACGEKPVDNPNGLKSRLTELQRQATDPPLANVEIEAYELSSASGTGFVMCLVPEGAYKPYRSEEGRKSQYYVRSGDNFTVLTRSMLQAMFYPRLQPRFSAWSGLIAAKIPDSKAENFEMKCSIQLHNDGTATAQDTFVLLRTNLTAKVRIEDFEPDWVSIATPASPFALKSTQAIHPGFVSQLCTINWIANSHPVHGDNPRSIPALGNLEISLTVFARDMTAQRITIRFEDDLFRTGYAHHRKGEMQVE